MKKILLLGTAVIAGAVLLALNMTNAKEPQGNLESFRMGESGMAYESGYMYYAKLKEGELKIQMRYQSPQGIVKKQRFTKDTAFMTGLDKVIRQQELHKWNGYKKSNKNVLDGDSFGLSIGYRNGKELKTISAYGSNSFPKGYRDAAKAVGDYFQTEVEKLPSVKESYTLSEMQPKLQEALQVLRKQEIITGLTAEEISSFQARGNRNLALITVDATVASGHVLQLRIFNNKLWGIKCTETDNKTAKPVYFVRDHEDGMRKAQAYRYADLFDQ